MPAMPASHADVRWMSGEDIRDLYAEQADRMERFAWINRVLTGRTRRDLFGRAEGRVLDVACGMGMNRQYLPGTVEYTGIDLSPAMLAKAAPESDWLEPGDTVLEMDAQDLAFDENSFDTVISSLSTCTFPDPEVALGEMDRVCQPDGRILLLEHGRSDVDIIGRFQDWRAESFYENHGCHWNQDPVDLVSQAGLAIHDSTTGSLGILTAIEARPTRA